MRFLRSLSSFFGGLCRDAVNAVRQWSWAKKILVAAAVVGFFAVTVLFDVPPLATLRVWADSAGGWFVVAFWFAYVLITQFPVPRTILTLSAGVLFGPWVGILLSLTATAAAAAVSLSIVRGLLGEWIRPYLRHPAVAGINRRLEQRGWLAVASLRMIAGIPFSVLNYAAALTSVRLVPFTVATFIGSAPGTIAMVFFGDTLTGEADPVIIAITVALAVVGVVGLLLDSRIPVKEQN